MNRLRVVLNQEATLQREENDLRNQLATVGLDTPEKLAAAMVELVDGQ